MHSWVFRHRQRLRVIFGIVAEELGETTAELGGGEPPKLLTGGPEAKAGPERGAPESGRKGRLGVEPGQVARRGRWVVLAPMPHRWL